MCLASTQGYPDPSAFCINVGYVLAEEICFIIDREAREIMYKVWSRSPLPKHVLHYYNRQRGQGIPPLVNRVGPNIAFIKMLCIRQKVSKCKSDTTWRKWFTQDYGSSEGPSICRIHVRYKTVSTIGVHLLGGCIYYAEYGMASYAITASHEMIISNQF